MRIRNVPIHPGLGGVVEKLWVFESSGKVPDNDMKLIVPNGLIKMIIPYRNGVSGKINDYHLLSREHNIILIGVADAPATVDIEEDAPSGSIGIEFNPTGAYRFFRLNYRELKNKIYPFQDILGSVAKELEERIGNTTCIDQKIGIVQNFLLRLLDKSERDLIYDYCIRQIHSAGGNLSVRHLEQKTGYSTRWLNLKFTEKMGISPKHYGSILRFQQCYRALLTNRERIFREKEFHHYYYDQAHFIREFKKYTGLSPTRFENQINNFGRIFYKK